MLVILTSGCLSQIQVSPQQRPGQAGFSPRFCPCYNVRGEGAGAFLDSVLSCLQLSPVKREFGSVKAVVRREEPLALAQLCMQPWFEIGTFSLDHQCLSTSDLAWYHQELQFLYYKYNRNSFPTMRNKSFEIKLTNSCFCWFIFKQGIVVFQILNWPLSAYLC